MSDLSISQKLVLEGKDVVTVSRSSQPLLLVTDVGELWRAFGLAVNFLRAGCPGAQIWAKAPQKSSFEGDPGEFIRRWVYKVNDLVKFDEFGMGEDYSSYPDNHDEVDQIYRLYRRKQAVLSGGRVTGPDPRD